MNSPLDATTNDFLLAALAVGAGATLGMDLWNLFLRSVFGIPSLDYCLLGRWIRHIPGGTFRHADIRRAEPKWLECPAGWAGHYGIGLVLAVGFLLIAPRGWLDQPTLLPALAFGIGTVVLPYFVLQPSLGFGIASSKAPDPTRARLKSLATHTVFGIGLYLSALVVSRAS